MSPIQGLSTASKKAWGRAINNNEKKKKKKKPAKDNIPIKQSIIKLGLRYAAFSFRHSSNNPLKKDFCPDFVHRRKLLGFLQGL